MGRNGSSETMEELKGLRDYRTVGTAWIEISGGKYMQERCTEKQNFAVVQ